MKKNNKLKIGRWIISLKGIKGVSLNNMGCVILKISYESGLNIEIKEFEIDSNVPLDYSSTWSKMQKIADKIMELAIPGNEILNIEDLI